MAKSLDIAVVGPCTSGKSTLVTNLKKLGCNAWAVAQEHSDVKWLWKHKNPNFLVLLDVTIETAHKRRNISWGERKLADQHLALADARANCNIYLPTDNMTADEVAARVIADIEKYSLLFPAG